MYSYRLFFSCLTMYLFACIYAREEGVTHKWEGNLALPTSQQPSPLFAIGQSIVDQGNIQFFGLGDYLRGSNFQFTEVIPSILCGVTDNFSLFLNVPVAAQFQIDQAQEAGLEDIFLQAEYAFYNRDEEYFGIQATAVGILVLPTGSFNKNPATGVGAPSFFVGTTVSYMSTDWYTFFSPGVLIPAGRAKQRLNNRFLCQAGVGKNIAYSAENWLLTLILEVYGNGGKNNLSRVHSAVRRGGFGGNNFYIGPSVWFATQRFIFQAGIMASVLHNTLSGNGSKNYYWAAVNVGWKFN